VAFDIYDTLDRLGSLDPTQLALVQAYRRVVIVEDRTDRDLLAIFGAKLLGTEIWQQVERRLAFCFSKGNPWKQHDMSRLRQLLQQMIAVSGPALEVFVIADRDYYPDLPGLIQSLPTDHLHWHVWQRAEIENYLLDVGAIKRLIKTGEKQLTIDEVLLDQEFDQLVEASRNSANDRLVAAFDELRKRTKERWDAATMARKAREYLEQHWSLDRIALADAKSVVLPGIKRWLQNTGWGQFSDKDLADILRPEDLPQEVHEVTIRLVHFAGITTP
jgi:hypothetical protein